MVSSVVLDLNFTLKYKPDLRSLLMLVLKSHMHNQICLVAHAGTSNYVFLTFLLSFLLFFKVELLDSL